MANGLEMLSGRGKKDYAKEAQVVAEAGPDGMPSAGDTNGAGAADEEALVALERLWAAPPPTTRRPGASANQQGHDSEGGRRLAGSFGQEGERLPMAKSRKPSTARKPPEPTESHVEIEQWIRSVMPDLHPIVQRLDEFIRETTPGLQYAIKWKKAYYGLPGLGWIIEMVAYDVSVNVVFFGGADFDSPPPLGDTDRSRYVKVTTLEEAQRPEIHEWVEQAGRVPGWR